MIDTLDKTILEWFQSIQNDAATHFLSVLTKLGEAQKIIRFRRDIPFLP